MVALMSSLGAPLIPTIAAADHVSLPAAQWLLTAALLAGALVTPVMGRLADRPHQRQAVLIALAVVVLGSVHPAGPSRRCRSQAAPASPWATRSPASSARPSATGLPSGSARLPWPLPWLW
jgi:MFS family permease